MADKDLETAVEYAHEILKDLAVRAPRYLNKNDLGNITQAWQKLERARIAKRHVEVLPTREQDDAAWKALHEAGRIDAHEGG